MIWIFYFLLPVTCYIIGVICGRLSVTRARDSYGEDLTDGEV